MSLRLGGILISSLCFWLLFDVGGASTPAPKVKLWRFELTEAPADYELHFRAELLGAPRARVQRPSVTFTRGRFAEGEFGRPVVSPDHRHCYFGVRAGEPMKPMGHNDAELLFNAGAGKLTVRFPLEAGGARSEASVTETIQFYANGAISLGPHPLPREEQRTIVVSGTGASWRYWSDVVPVNSRNSSILIRCNRADTVAASLASACGLLAVAARPHKTQLLGCLQMNATAGRLSKGESNSDSAGGKVFTLWFYPWDAQGSMKAGVVDLTFTFLVRENARQRRVTSYVKAVVAPDGTCRIVNSRAQKPGLSPPRRHQAKERWGRWRLVAESRS